MKPNEQPSKVQLSPELVSQALACLYHQRQPQGELLALNLQLEHWEELSNLLLALLRERRVQSLH